ncbi:MAG: hypothetical protein ACR2PH_06645, partial [Desulfobulbia bacterium]
PYILATDSRPDDLRTTGYSLNLLLNRLQGLQKSKLFDGRVTLILESCFSGRSQVGELLDNVSAPALNLPLQPSEAGKDNQQFVVMAAAKGSQFAAWDSEFRRSVFTDALVNALYGEADEERFGGNADGMISLAEANQFVRSRIKKRLRSLKPGIVQEPDMFGGSPNQILVSNKIVTGIWPEKIERRREEDLQARSILRKQDISAAREFLRNCIYCERQHELSKFIRRMDVGETHCRWERNKFDDLREGHSIAEIESFIDSCQCCNDYKIPLLARLDTLRNSSASDKKPPQNDNRTIPTPPGSSGGIDSDAKEPGAGAGLVVPSSSVGTPPRDSTSLDRSQLIRALQEELARVGCRPGKVDGIWGSRSKSALKRFFLETTKAFDVIKPTTDSLERLKGAQGRVCKRVAKLPPDRDARGSNKRKPQVECLPGQKRNSKGRCYTPGRKACPSGQKRSSKGRCYTPGRKACPSGQRKNSKGHCYTPGSSYANRRKPPPKKRKSILCQAMEASVATCPEE